MRIQSIAKRCYKLLGEQKRRFIVVCILKVIIIAISIIPAYLTSEIIARFKSSEIGYLISCTVGLIIVYTFISLTEIAVSLCRQHLEKESRTAIKKTFLKRIFEFHPRVSRTNDTSKLTETLYSDVNNVVVFLFLCADIITSFLVVLVLVYLLVTINAGLFSVLLLFITTTVTVSLYLSKKLKLKNYLLREKTDVHFKLIRDIIKNTKSIYASDSISFYLNEYDCNLDSVKRDTVKRDRMAWWIGYLGSINEKAWTITFFLLCFRLVSTDSMSAIAFLLFFSFSRQFSSEITKLVTSYAGMQQAIISVERALNILDSASNCNEQTLTASFPKDFLLIKTENLSFSYEEKPVFSDIFLSIPANTCTTVIGKNGAGKTTLLCILGGLLAPCSGKVMIDDINLEGINLASTRKAMTFFLHDDILLDFTVRENMLSFQGSEYITNDDLYQVCSDLNITNDIMALEYGFDTLLSEARTLSYGQKRKILLARALLKPSQIVFFDEPLVGLDVETQMVVINQIKQLIGKKTVFISTHEPEVFPFSDFVIQLPQL